MEKEEKVPQYRTIKRLQKSYLVRCNESLKNIIPGTGVKPASSIRRVEREIKELRAKLSVVVEEELVNQMENTSQKKVKNVQELSAKRDELESRIKLLEKQLLEFELL
eukprot:TRINITY_DN34240_c0_g1_i1.p2 TRINITY_DN34240_c0_g1~~TRINITY_DN34240_c0_g1_i1.p2  ORF type:complete len:108 (+),score=45.86 TRINITY_DN34240_c0_g1_i1:62-385(+)